MRRGDARDHPRSVRFFFRCFPASAAQPSPRAQDADAKRSVTADGMMRRGKNRADETGGRSAVAQVQTLRHMIVLKRTAAPWNDPRVIIGGTAIESAASRSETERTSAEDMMMFSTPPARL